MKESNVKYKEFSKQINFCNISGNRELKPVDEKIFTFHNGILDIEERYFCKEFDCFCESRVCLNRRKLLKE